jgi:hypothetical protein
MRDVVKSSGLFGVTTTSQTLVAANRNRASLLISNPSDTAVTLAFGTQADGTVPTAVAGTGLVIPATSNVLEIKNYAGPIAVIHGGVGTKNISLVEI